MIAHIRKIDPSHIFVKDRGFPPGDPRRCRANLGGARPGYFGHEFEMKVVKWVSKGIDAINSEDPTLPLPLSPSVPEEPPLFDLQKLKQIIDAEVP